jgi:hypothetical protein
MLVRDVMSSPVVTLAAGPHLLRGLLEELGPPSPCRVAVREGVVELTGPSDPTVRRLATLLVRGVPGVVEVHFAEE